MLLTFSAILVVVLLLYLCCALAQLRSSHINSSSYSSPWFRDRLHEISSSLHGQRTLAVAAAAVHALPVQYVPVTRELVNMTPGTYRSVRNFKDP